MIAWGGVGDGGVGLNTGGRYDPSIDTWTPITTEGVPEARNGHTAIWTGKYMIVWGGSNILDTFNTGGQYDPSSEAWIPIAIEGAPETRSNHTAVWTDSQMIIWGGIGHSGVLNTGGQYDPSSKGHQLQPKVRLLHGYFIR